MTFLATLAVFSMSLAVLWLSQRRAGGKHECSCGRTRRVLNEYERWHSRQGSPDRSSFIPVAALSPAASVREASTNRRVAAKIE